MLESMRYIWQLNKPLLSVVDSTFNQSKNVAIAVVSSSMQLLLTCIKGCGLRSGTNTFKVRAAACTLYY